MEQKNSYVALLKGFVLERVLQDDTLTRRLSLLGNKVIDNEKVPMILDIEWVKFASQPLFLEALLGFLCNSVTVDSIEPIFQNDVWYGFQVSIPPGPGLECGPHIRCDAVCPASEADITKRTIQDKALVLEGWDLYSSKVAPFICSQPRDRVAWVQKLVDCTAENETIYCRRDLDNGCGYLIASDSKWDKKTPTTLYLLAILYDKERQLYSIRDLRYPRHVELLKSLQKDIISVLRDQFRLSYDQVRVYFHYPPTFYWLHVHICHVQLESFGALVGRAHLLDDVIDHLDLAGEKQYYQIKTIPSIVGTQSALWKECYEGSKGLDS